MSHGPVRTVCLTHALLLLPACGDDDIDEVVTTRASSTADFTPYETFAFVEPDEDQRERIPDDVAVNLASVSNAMRQELLALGLQEVQADDDPDLNAFNVAATEDESAISWECVPNYWYGYWSYSWNPCAWLAPMYTEYEVGTVALGLSDPEREEVVFGGVIQGVLDDDDQSDIDEAIDEGVQEIFEDYPDQQTGTPEGEDAADEGDASD